MNRHTIAALLLLASAFAAHAQQPPLPSAGAPDTTVGQAVGPAAGRETGTRRLPFGTELASRVTIDIADRVDRALQTHLARHSEDAVIDHAPRSEPQLVKAH